MRSSSTHLSTRHSTRHSQSHLLLQLLLPLLLPTLPPPMLPHPLQLPRSFLAGSAAPLYLLQSVMPRTLPLLQARQTP